MTTLLLVRHGQTDWNVEGRYQGQADPPLNETGRAQARALAAQLDGTPVDALYSSDLRRAQETAQIIAAQVGVTVKLDPRLREVHQGEWDGLLVAEIMERYPREWAARQSNPGEARAPGGESVPEVAARVRAAADHIARQHPRGQIVVVSHGLSLATLLCGARGLALSAAHELIPENARLHPVDWPPPARPAV